MILGYEEPVFNLGSKMWEIKIQVQGQYEIYTQIVNFETIKSAQGYIELLKKAIKQREGR